MKEELYDIHGFIEGNRITTRTLEAEIQKALNQGKFRLKVEAHGQHGIGGRLWGAGDQQVYLQVTGYPGQRLGSMGFPNTCIECMAPASDDTGWLNVGAEITIHGNATNGTANAMAQGRIYVGGKIGARGMTMTKHNPRFAPPELWVLGSAGDSFAEFMAGGIAVVCGVDPHDPKQVLGYRPCVGMVSGKIFFRGRQASFCEHDAKLVDIDDDNWAWLETRMPLFLEKIHRSELGTELLNRGEWRLLVAKTPFEKKDKARRSMVNFRRQIWEAELGKGGMIGDLVEEAGQVPLIVTGDLRRYRPTWEHAKAMPPCQFSCPSGIPVHRRWALIREGKVQEALDLSLNYTPLPATVCGYLCPNLCMENCTRGEMLMEPVDVSTLGQASINAIPPEPEPPTGHSIAVIGGGPGGLSVAWQLALKGHRVTVVDREQNIGGKIHLVIPKERIPEDVLDAELDRMRGIIAEFRTGVEVTADVFDRMKQEFEYIVIATGAYAPRTVPIPGGERIVNSLEFLRKARSGGILELGKAVVVIGAGNVGCDAAAQAGRYGAENITLVDIQEPASFGKERKAAEAAGARFVWPKFVEKVDEDAIWFTDGDRLPADTVIMAIGDMPVLDFIPEKIKTERGFILADDTFQTTDPQVFAIGDVVKPGLITDAIGMGRVAAEKIDALTEGREYVAPKKEKVDTSLVQPFYFEPRAPKGDLTSQARSCASCGTCRDCGICQTVCPMAAIDRQEEDGEPILSVIAERCIGCGFCVAACPCGIWHLVENELSV